MFDIKEAVQRVAASGGGVVTIPPGVHSYDSPVTLDDSLIILRGAGRRRSILKAAHPEAVIEVGSNTVVEDLAVDGAGIARWGIKTTAQANKPSLTRVRVEGCTEAGFVFHATQNATITDCTAQYNPVNFAFYNGVANTKLINCHGNNHHNALGGSPAERSILIANSTDPRLGSAVYAGGNRNIDFIGGIFERGSGDYVAELAHGGGKVAFIGTEITSGTVACVRVAPTFGAHPVHSISSTWALGANTTLAFRAEAGHVQHIASTYTGTSRRHPLALSNATGAASISHQGRALTPGHVLSEAASSFRTDWSAFGPGGAATYNPIKRRLLITSQGASSGARTYWLPLAGYGVAHRHLRVRAILREVTGTVQVNAATSASPYRRPIGTSAGGEFTALVEMHGDEVGIEMAGATSGASFELAALQVSII